MNLLDLAGNVWQANERFIHSTFDLGGSLFNKMTELTGLVPKNQPQIVSSQNSRGWIGFKRIVIIGGIGASIYFVYYWWKNNRKRRVPYVENYENDLVYLFQFPRPLSIPSLCPYALKLETWLRMSDINYHNVEGLSIFHRSTEGTLPYVELNGEVIVDSANIIDVLPQKLNRDSTESHLKPEQNALVRSIESMLELSLNYCSANYRYSHMDEFMQIYPPNFTSFPLARPLLKWYMKSNFRKRLQASSIGRHSDELVEKIGNKDLQALSDQLGSKHYLTGFKPTRADAALFASLCLILYVPFDNPQRLYINKNCNNLYEFAERIRIRYWPDWAQITTLCKLNTDWKRMIKPSSSRPASRPASTAP